MKQMRLVVLAAAVTAALGAGTGQKFRRVYEQHLRGHNLEQPQRTYSKGIKSLRRIIPADGLDLDGWRDMNPDWADGSAFDQVDQDEDGVIWFQELNAFASFLTEHPDLPHIGRKPRRMDAALTQDVVEGALKSANPRGPGLYATKQQMGAWRARESFAAYDANGDGTISRREFADVLYHPVVLNRFKRLRNNRERSGKEGKHQRKRFDANTETIRAERAPFCDFHCARPESRLERESGNRRSLFGWTEAAETAVGTACSHSESTDCKNASEALNAGMDCGGALTGDVIAAAKCAYHGISDLNAAWESDYEQHSTTTDGHSDNGSCDGDIRIEQSPSWWSCSHEGMHTCGGYCCCMLGYGYDESAESCQPCPGFD